MNRTNLRTALALAAGSYLAIPLATHATNPNHGEAGDTSVPATSPATVTLPGSNVTVNADGRTSFTIDLSAMGFSELWAVKMSDRTKIVFRDDKKAAPPAECPYFDLAVRKYEVFEVGKYVYRVVAPISASEKKLIEQAGCLLTRTISESEIKPLRPR